MDEQSFLDEIAASPNNRNLLRSYAYWLLAHHPTRGEFLTAVLDRRDAEDSIRVLTSKIYQFPRTELDLNWLNLVLPIVVHAPTTGTFYAAPAPNDPPFIQVGEFCNPGTRIGYVEAQKVFYPIEVQDFGVVSHILACNGESVDFGQPLVLLHHSLHRPLGE